MSHYFLCSQNKHSKNLRFFQCMVSDFGAANFFKKESRSPRGFLPKTSLLCAHKSVAPPPLLQKNSGGARHFRFRFLDLCIRFGKIISKACPVGNLFSFGVCEGFNSGAKKLDTNSDFEDGGVPPPSPANGGAGLRFARATPSLWREMKRILMLSGESVFSFLKINNTNL